jgi:hypothetical protein
MTASERNSALTEKVKPPVAELAGRVGHDGSLHSLAKNWATMHGVILSLG